MKLSSTTAHSKDTITITLFNHGRTKTTLHIFVVLSFTTDAPMFFFVIFPMFFLA
jgi:hypothetical protein